MDFLQEPVYWEVCANPCQKIDGSRIPVTQTGRHDSLAICHKSERLSRYAPKLVDMEEKKIIKFLEGLNPILEQHATGVVLPATFQEALKRACKFEDIHNKIIKDAQRKR